MHRFAVRVIKMSDHLPRNRMAGQILGRQVVRSSTSIVANLEEAQASLTKRESVHRTGVARKESKETLRWLLLIRDAELLPANRLHQLIDEAQQITAMLTAGLKRFRNIA